MGLLGTLILIFIYCFANIAYIAALGPKGVAASNTVAADAVGALMGGLEGQRPSKIPAFRLMWAACRLPARNS